jgi:hypothetical protein
MFIGFLSGLSQLSSYQHLIARLEKKRLTGLVVVISVWD